MSRIIKAHEVAPKKVDWLWRERIPRGMITIVAGKPDVGKGMFAVHVAAALSKRGENVIYSAQEDDAGMMTRPRLEAAGADLDRVFLWRFRVPESISELANHVMDNDVKLVIMDPFAAHLSNGISRHSDNVRVVTGAMSEIAEASGCAFLIVEHALKRVSPKAHPLTAIGGSGSGLPAASRMAFVFGTDPEDHDRKILCCVKANIRDQPKAISFEVDTEELPIVGEVASIVAEGECEFDARKLLSQESEKGKVGRPPDKRASAAEWLTMYLYGEGKPVKAGTVMEDAKQHGLSSKTVRRAADDMGVLRNPPGGGRNCTWDLPQDVKDAMGGTSDGG